VNIEDRLRAATRVRADLVRDIRPLELPEQAPGRARRAARAWGGWLGPVAAAAAVIAVAVSLVTVRHAAAPAVAAPPTAPAAVLAKIPRYYAAITQDGSTRDFTVVDVRTGKRVVDFAAPGDEFLDGVSASSDDKTFILTSSAKVDQDTTRWTVRKVRLFPHPGLAFNEADIAVQGTDDATHLNAYLSPNGGEVAVQFERVAGPTVTTTIQTYHATETSPAPLRTWTATMRGAAPIGDLSWRDVQSLEFSTPVSGVTAVVSPAYSQERALNTTAPGGDLMGTSRLVYPGPTAPDPVSCAATRLTPDGKTAVCGTQVSTVSGKPAVGCDASLGLVAYNVRTRERERMLASYQKSCNAGRVVPLWTDTTASTVVGLFWATDARSTQTVLGLAVGGRLYSLPLPGIPAGGTGDATTIAF
jgi:hypothetical protein